MYSKQSEDNHGVHVSRCHMADQLVASTCLGPDFSLELRKPRRLNTEAKEASVITCGCFLTGKGPSKPHQGSQAQNKQRYKCWENKGSGAFHNYTHPSRSIQQCYQKFETIQRSETWGQCKPPTQTVLSEMSLGLWPLKVFSHNWWLLRKLSDLTLDYQGKQALLNLFVLKDVYGELLYCWTWMVPFIVIMYIQKLSFLKWPVVRWHDHNCDLGGL